MKKYNFWLDKVDGQYVLCPAKIQEDPMLGIGSRQLIKLSQEELDFVKMYKDLEHNWQQFLAGKAAQ